MATTVNFDAAVDVVVTLGMAIEKAQRDGFQLTDIFSFIPALSDLPAVLKNKEAVIAEFKAMDKAAKEVSFAKAAAKFSIANTRVEKLVELGVDALLSVGLFITAVTATVPTAPKA